MAKSILFRMASGIPGDISRMQSSIVESVIINDSLPFTVYGVPGKKVSGKFVPFAGGETAADLFGFFVRPFPTQGADAAALVPSTAKYGADNAMRSGYMTVKNNSGVPADGGKVYVRLANASAGKPIGGVEAADEHTNVGTAGANTGNGTIGSITAAETAKTGNFVATMLTATTFRVADPDGNRLVDGATGVAYSAAGIGFTITVGGTPMVAGDSFTIAVVRNTIPLSRAFFKSAADAVGNVEIELRIN